MSKIKPFNIKPYKGLITFFDLETAQDLGDFWRAGYEQNITPGQIILERQIISAQWRTVGDKNVEWDILPAGLTDGAEIAAMKRKLRQRISPVIARIKAHPKHCNKDYATHSGFAVCENGDMVITVIVERIK